MKTKPIYDKSFKNGWVVIDVETGEIVEDGQGYGFKSAQKAMACYSYKHRSPQQVEDEKHAKAWMRKHKDVREDVEAAAWYRFKDGEPDLTQTEFEAYLKERQLDTEGVPVRALFKQAIK